MKKIKTLLLVTLTLLGVSVSAQQENSVLWQISGNNLQNPSYLFGTIHIICPDDLELSPKIIKALESSEQIVMELDIDEPTFMQDVQKLSFNDKMKNISSELSEEDLKLVNAFFEKHYQVDMSKLGIMKPMVLSSMVVAKSIDCKQAASYEATLMEYSKEQDWELKGLETIQDQMNVFNTVSSKEQLSWLVEGIKDEVKSKSEMNELTIVYKDENINKMLELMKEHPEFKEMEEAILYERNEKWIKSIINEASEKSTFFAVGAAHLGSERGLIQLLKKEGYTVKAIME